MNHINHGRISILPKILKALLEISLPSIYPNKESKQNNLKSNKNSLSQAPLKNIKNPKGMVDNASQL